MRGGSGLAGPYGKAYKSSSAWEHRPRLGRVDISVSVHLPVATVAATTPPHRLLVCVAALLTAPLTPVYSCRLPYPLGSACCSPPAPPVATMAPPAFVPPMGVSPLGRTPPPPLRPLRLAPRS